MLRKLFLGLALLAALCGHNLRAQTIVITPSTTTFSPAGGSITFTTTISYSTVPSVLAFSTTLPNGWTYSSAAGANVPPIAPSAGATGTLSFSYITTPSSPASFTFTASYPASLTGLQPIVAVTDTRDTSTSSNVTRDSTGNVVTRDSSGNLPTTTNPAITLSGPPTTVFTWQGTDGASVGSWSESAAWSPHGVPNNSGLTTFTAKIIDPISRVAISASDSFTVSTLILQGGAINNLGTLKLVDTGSTWNGGIFTGAGQLINAAAAQLTASGTAAHDFNQQTITNQGQFTWVDSGALRSGGGGAFINAAGATFTDSSTTGTAAATQITTGSFSGSFTFTNAGNYTKTASGETKISVPFTNTGNIAVSAGTLHFDTTFTQGGGNISVSSGSVLQFDLGLALAAGSLTGGGTVQSNVTNSALISPGNTVGKLTVQGNLTLLSTSQLLFDISAANATPGVTYDFLSVNGTVTLGGTLALNVVGTGRSTILPTDTFTLLTGTSLTGTFANVPNVAGGFRLTSLGGQGSFLVTYSGTSVFLSGFNPIPEPSTWALLATGLGAIGFVTLRRRPRK